jgi:hypothetical protein
MVLGGGPQFPDVDPRFDLLPKHLFGPFWTLTVIDTAMGLDLNPVSRGFLTGYGSVRRQAKYGTQRYLMLTLQQQQRWGKPV